MNNKVLTISIAAYNVEKYITNTLESLIVSNDLEVLIINDGSKDKTPILAEEYTRRFPDLFKLVNKENGGYGSTINIAIKMATGKYFKQLDGDDWFEKANLDEFIHFLRRSDADCIYSPFWRVYQNKGKRVLQQLHNPTKDVMDARNIAMHALTFKTTVLQKNNINITEHCFYTDCEYNLKPLMFVKQVDYFNKPIYCYRLEEEGQSVSKSGWTNHYHEHNKVTLEIMAYYEQNKDKMNISNKSEIEKYIIQVYKTNFVIALELDDKTIQNTFTLFDLKVKQDFPQFYNIINKKIILLRKSNYTIWNILRLYHNVFESKII